MYDAEPVPAAHENFRAALEAKLREHFQRSYPTLAVRDDAPWPAISLMRGDKYTRIVRRDGAASPTRTAYGWIDNATGNLFRAAGWKSPAPHPRGNIADPDPLAACEFTGLKTLPNFGNPVSKHPTMNKGMLRG